jgi:hypothetical protein
MAFDKCPQCGYTIVPENKTRHGVMNTFVTADGKRKTIMPRSEDEFDAIPDEKKPEEVVHWIREEIFLKRAADVKKAPSTTTK